MHMSRPEEDFVSTFISEKEQHILDPGGNNTPRIEFLMSNQNNEEGATSVAVKEAAR